MSLKTQVLGVILLLIQLSTQVSITKADEVLESVHINNWGDWGEFQNCTQGTSVQSFQLMTEAQGSGDDTALNGIRFYCGLKGNEHTSVITSTVGGWGSWGRNFSCGFGRGYMYGFQLNVEPYQESGDDSSTNNLRIFCSDDQDPVNDFLEGDGLNLGMWNAIQDIRRCGTGEAICGLQTQVEKYQGDDDDTSLNNIRVKCCRMPTTQ